MKYKSLILLLACMLVLLGVRVALSETVTYVFLIWNVFLAFVPYYLSNFFVQALPKISFKTTLLFIAWLLFLPNSFYVITDFVHLKERVVIPIWYDAMLLFTATFTSLLLGLSSLINVEMYLQKIVTKQMSYIIIIGCLFLSGFGVYLGRFLRFNSWDVMQQPSVLVIEIYDRCVNPLQHLRTWSVTIVFTFFTACCWLIFKNFNHRSQPNVK